MNNLQNNNQSFCNNNSKFASIKTIVEKQGDLSLSDLIDINKLEEKFSDFNFLKVNKEPLVLKDEDDRYFYHQMVFSYANDKAHINQIPKLKEVISENDINELSNTDDTKLVMTTCGLPTQQTITHHLSPNIDFIINDNDVLNRLNNNK